MRDGNTFSKKLSNEIRESGLSFKDLPEPNPDHWKTCLDCTKEVHMNFVCTCGGNPWNRG